MYSVIILKAGIFYAVLSVKGKTSWKTKRTAIKHCKSFNTVNYIKGFNAVIHDDSYPIHDREVHIESALYRQLK